MTLKFDNMHWEAVSHASSLIPGLGMGALVRGTQVAVFRCSDGKVRAISNFDPIGDANVLARGLLGYIAGRRVVASPLYKQHFDLETGECLEEPSVKIPTFAVRECDGVIEVGIAA